MSPFCELRHILAILSTVHVYDFGDIFTMWIFILLIFSIYLAGGMCSFHYFYPIDRFHILMQQAAAVFVIIWITSHIRLALHA